MSSEWIRRRASERCTTGSLRTTRRSGRARSPQPNVRVTLACEGAGVGGDRLGVERGFDRAVSDFSLVPRKENVELSASYRDWSVVLRELSEQAPALIVSLSFLTIDAIAHEHPGTHYLVFDHVGAEPNVSYVHFHEREASFLAGTAAALMSQTGIVGFIGGWDAIPIWGFLAGYEAGARATNGGVRLLTAYAAEWPKADGFVDLDGNEALSRDGGEAEPAAQRRRQHRQRDSGAPDRREEQHRRGVAGERRTAPPRRCGRQRDTAEALRETKSNAAEALLFVSRNASAALLFVSRNASAVLLFVFRNASAVLLFVSRNASAVLLFAPTSRTRIALPAAAVVQQQVRRAAVVGDQEIEIAVVVDVAGRERAADPSRAKPGPACFVTSDETLAVVSEQQLSLRELRAGTDLRHVRHHVAVGDRDVEPGVVVVVEEGDAEADIRTRRGSDAAADRDVREQPPPRFRNRLCISVS